MLDFFVLSDEVDEIEVYGSEAQSGTQLATYSFEVKSLTAKLNCGVDVHRRWGRVFSVFYRCVIAYWTLGLVQMPPWVNLLSCLRRYRQLKQSSINATVSCYELSAQFFIPLTVSEQPWAWPGSCSLLWLREEWCPVCASGKASLLDQSLSHDFWYRTVLKPVVARPVCHRSSHGAKVKSGSTRAASEIDGVACKHPRNNNPPCIIKTHTGKCVWVTTVESCVCFFPLLSLVNLLNSILREASDPK